MTIDLSTLTARQLQEESARVLAAGDGFDNGELVKFNKLANHDSHAWYRAVIAWYVNRYDGLPSVTGPGTAVKLLLQQPNVSTVGSAQVYTYESIRSVHLELTSKCNASCPMCARNKFGGPDNEFLPNTELSLIDIKRIMSIDFVQQLDRLYLCGNYGDPIVANDTLEVLEWLRAVNPGIKLGVHTNASAKTAGWWAKLGKLLSKPGDYVKFGIDGLEDTNHIYRRGTHWRKIMDNAAAFIKAGGIAHWEYIVFKHNEHQVYTAQQLSEQMGFAQFRTKKTGRFFSNTRLEGTTQQQVLNRKGEVEYYIEKPNNPLYHNDSLTKEQALVDAFGNMQNYLDQTCIKCKVAEDKSLYISAEGLAFPCCWTANQLYVWYWPYKKSEIWDLIDGDTANVSALVNDLKSVIEGKYFKDIADSWNKPSVSAGKLRVCAKTCGTGFDQFASQFKSKATAI
jgi:MoaA/NifB/PqqE/SkfB family radical SAM enzyme